MVGIRKTMDAANAKDRMNAKDKGRRGDAVPEGPVRKAGLSGQVRTALLIAAIVAAIMTVLAVISSVGVNVPVFTETYEYLAHGKSRESNASGYGGYTDLSPDGIPYELAGSGGAWDGVEIRPPAFSILYDASEETEFCVFKDYLAECSRDNFSLFDKNGYEVFRKSLDFAKPSMRRRGDYLLVSDLGGRSAFLMKGAKPVWEGAFTSGIINGTVNKGGYISFALDAPGYRNSVRVLAPVGKPLFDWVIADDYVLGSDVSPSGKELVINRLKTNGVGLSSGLEFLDLKSEPFRFVESGEDEVFLNAFYLEDNSLAAVTEDTFYLYSESGERLFKETFESVMAFCEFPQKKAAVAVRRHNRVLVVEYGADATKSRAVFVTDKPVRNLSADNGLLFINLGNEIAVMRENDKTAINLTLDGEALYGGASEKLGVLTVTGKSADVYGF